MSRSVVRIGRRDKGVGAAGGHGREGRAANALELNTRVELIQALIPIGLEAVNELLQQEVCQLAGERYRRAGGVPGYARWGSQRGSVYLGDQKVPSRRCGFGIWAAGRRSRCRGTTPCRISAGRMTRPCGRS